MSKKTNEKNDAQLSDERIDNLFRIMEGPSNTISESSRLAEKVRKYLDKIYLDGFSEGIEVGMEKLKEL